MAQKYKVTFWFLILSLFIALILIASTVFVDAFNEFHTVDRQHEVFSRNYMEYKILGISSEDCVNKLTRMIENDSSACYGNRRFSYTKSSYIKAPEIVYQMKSYKSGRFHNGTKMYEITFLIPYDNSNIHLSGNFFIPGFDKEIRYRKYQNKINYSIEIIDTSPVTLLLAKGQDIDEQNLLNNLHRYFENHYLQLICRYERRDFWNNYFFCVKWSCYHFYYLIFWWVVILLIVYLSEKYIKKKRQKRKNI